MTASSPSSSAERPSAPRDSEDLRRRLRVLESLDLSTTTVAELVVRVRELCDSSLTPSRRLINPALFRARAVLNTPGSIEELWYPKPEWVTTLGRANDVGDPIL